eukprot:scaffold273505_cov19-Tisochrysis_lutea.AAC.1
MEDAPIAQRSWIFAAPACSTCVTCKHTGQRLREGQLTSMNVREIQCKASFSTALLPALVALSFPEMAIKDIHPWPSVIDEPISLQHNWAMPVWWVFVGLEPI